VSKAEDAFDLCGDMRCTRIFREADCNGACPLFNDRMKMVGSIYMVLPDDTAGFVGRLPRPYPIQDANSPNRAANNVEPAPEYPPSGLIPSSLDQA